MLYNFIVEVSFPCVKKRKTKNKQTKKIYISLYLFKSNDKIHYTIIKIKTKDKSTSRPSLLDVNKMCVNY